MQVTQYSDDKKITWYKLLMRHIQVSDLATPTCLSGTVRALYLLQLPILARKGNHRRYGALAVPHPKKHHALKQEMLLP